MRGKKERTCADLFEVGERGEGDEEGGGGGGRESRVGIGSDEESVREEED